MSARVAVTKMHGARNDFVVVDARTAGLSQPEDFARTACERRTGIGADGLLLIGTSERADIAMRIINADGTEAEMCGNGIRCVARYVDERSRKDSLLIETLGGPIETAIVERGPVYRVRVNMGTPRVQPVQNSEGDGIVVTTGNPHFVRFEENVDRLDLGSYGAAMQRDERFPHGVNVHVVAPGRNEGSLRVRHFERGVGLTMACGTGAVAAAAAAIVSDRARGPVLVEVPGGELIVEWDGEGDAYLTGPAVRVFDTVL